MREWIHIYDSRMAGKVQVQRLSVAERQKLERELRTVLSSMERSDDTTTLVQSLLTPSEVVMLARRIQVAKLLVRGLSHDGIRKKLKVGLNTVQLVDRWLGSAWPEYRGKCPALFQDKSPERRLRGPAAFGTFRWLRKTYPSHYALFNLLLGEP